MEFLKLLEGIRTPFFDQLFSLITLCGEETVYLVLVMVMLWCVDKRWGYRMMYIGVTGTALNQLLKAVFVIPRPWVLDESFTIVESAREGATGYSFPSGHTQSVVNAFGGIVMWRKGKFVIPCAIVILLTAFSRMYLGVHTPLDVGVSLIMGTLSVVGFSIMFERFNGDRKKIILAGAGACLFTVAALLYVLFAPKGANNVAEFDAHGVDAVLKVLGMTLGLCTAWLLEQKFVNFEVKAVWWAQICKAAIGFAIVVAIKALLKQPLLDLFGGSYVGNMVRYFIMCLAGVVLWPMTFKWWSRLGKKNAAASAQ